MSGDLLVEPDDQPAAPHHRLLLDFQDHWRLAFNDPRKFGRVWLVADSDQIIGNLGPEPLDPAFSPEELYRRLVERRRQLKPLLLDQTFLAGLGNIYSDEALHLARLHPQALSHSVTAEQAERLWRSIRQVLQDGINRHGTSIDWIYRGGDYQKYLRAYGRTGEACPECGTPIRRLIVGQRSTHICPNCQILPDYSSES
jgi:formamidopyrimidine-DNA glycosylase